MASDDWLQKPTLELHIIVNLAHDLDPMDLPIKGEPRLSRFRQMKTAIKEGHLVAVLRGDQPNIWSVVPLFLLWNFAFVQCAGVGEWDWLRSFCKKWADARGETFPEVTAAQNRHAKIGAETDCCRWLIGLMRKGLRKKSKRQYRSDAAKMFGVGARGFDRAWANAITESGNTDWSKPGRIS